MKLNPPPRKLTPYVEINSKYPADLNKCKKWTHESTRSSIGEYAQAFELRKEFLDKTQKH